MPTERSTAAVIAAALETLTRPRFHTLCGDAHTPGPCNDGITRELDPEQPETSTTGQE